MIFLYRLCIINVIGRSAGAGDGWDCRHFAGKIRTPCGENPARGEQVIMLVDRRRPGRLAP
jgi:hypothetical protein